MPCTTQESCSALHAPAARDPQAGRWRLVWSSWVIFGGLLAISPVDGNAETEKPKHAEAGRGAGCRKKVQGMENNFTAPAGQLQCCPASQPSGQASQQGPTCIL